LKILRWLVLLPAVFASLIVLGQETRPKEGEPAKEKRKRVQTNMAGFELLAADKLKQQTTVVGATRSLSPAPAVPLAPYLGQLFGPQPNFQWANPGKVKEFVFVLLDEAGGEVVRKTLAESRYRYDGPPLQAGKTYSWMVNTRATTSQEASFKVVDAKTKQEIEAALGKLKAGDEADLQRARLLAERRLWYDAIDAYTGVIARHPDLAQAYEERGAIFAQVARAETAANEDFARADELSQKASR
jgi:hypothetical protein